jgi:16S rRNA (uracil1498-N3)-methyltransferase
MPDSLPRFFSRAGGARGDRVVMQADESRHARVRRLAPGDRVALFDGNGRSYIATVDQCTGKQLAVHIDEELPPDTGESPLRLTLAIAMLKSDRFEWMIEKATELGVARVRPFVSEHALARPSAAKQSRWSAIALSAAKQCGRSVIPHVEPPCDFDAILTAADPTCLFFWERSPSDARLPDATQQATLIIGPEGGFSDAEAARARRAGCHIASLGPRILRAETAAITAVALLQSAWGDLGRVAVTVEESSPRRR